MIPHSKVFVGGLPSGSKPHELRRLFENYGVVTECDIMNRCGFVHMENPQMADNAIRALHNTSFKGSVISVEPGRPKERAGGGGGMGRGGPVGAGGGMGRGGGGPMGRGGPGGGPNQRMGGNMGTGPPRGNFDNPRPGPGGPPPGRGGNGGGPNMSGPMRRERGGMQRRSGGEPYNRNVRTGNFQDNFPSGGGPGGNRNFDMNSGPSSSNNGPTNAFGSTGGSVGSSTSSGGSGGHFAMGNQDKRGFALPDQGFKSNRGGGAMMGPGQTGGNKGGFNNNANPFNRPMAMNASGGGAGGGFPNNSNPFNRPVGGGNMNMNSDRRFGGQGRGGYRGGQRNQAGPGGGHDNSGFPVNQNYNEAFPPLGANRGNPGRGGGFGNRGGGGGRGGFSRPGGMGNRNGPPRRDNMMPNRRQ